jgi:hypothetical protein
VALSVRHPRASSGGLASLRAASPSVILARQSPDLRQTAARLRFASVSNAKTEAVELIKKLPDDATLEDIQHHLYVLEKIKQGQQRLVSEGGIPQAVMEQDMARWTSP